jgi:two-component system response regulator NreC
MIHAASSNRTFFAVLCDEFAKCRISYSPVLEFFSDSRASEMPISVLIVDDSKLLREVMRDYLKALTDWKIGGEAADGPEAIEKAMELKPDLILLDFSMPKMNGIEAASVLKKMMPAVHIVVFTMFNESLGLGLSQAFGVDMVVSKSEGMANLVKSVQRLLH